MAAEIPAEPASREEQYLASMAGQNAETPPCPWNRKEAYLDAIDGKMSDIEQEIEDLKNNPDVVDIVDTYADLQAYDTSNLGDKDIIRVLNDETHNDESTYYRYNKASNNWTYIGTTGPKGGEQSDWEENDSAGPAYIKNRPFYSETVESEIPQGQSQNVGNTPDSGYVWFAEQVQDYALHTVLADFEDGDTVLMTVSYSVGGTVKTDTGKFILTIENNEASLDSDMPATSRWNGGYASESSGDTTFRWPVATADASQTIYLTKVEYEKVKQIDAKYLPDTGPGVNVVQTTGTSTTDVMSQNAATEMVFADPGTKQQVRIGSSFFAPSQSANYVAIGGGSIGSSSDRAIAIGVSATVTSNAGGSIALGYDANASRPGAIALRGSASGAGSVAIGSYSNATAQGQVDIGTSLTGHGYNNSNYRLLSGVYDPQSAHDAATKGYVDATTQTLTNAQYQALWEEA